MTDSAHSIAREESTLTPRGYETRAHAALARSLGSVGTALILLNGPPASGKSTLADRLVSVRPLTLDLDIDLVRRQLGGWLDRSTEAGVAARDLAISMIDTHLGAGHDVVVPQFLARTDFIDRLEGAAVANGANFIEIALDITRVDAVAAFEERRSTPTDPTHRDAADLVDRSESADPVGEMYDALHLLLESRPQCCRIQAPRGDIDTTVSNILRALSDRGVNW